MIEPNSKKSNAGLVRSSAGGSKFIESFGKDDSDFTGTAKAERGRELGGGITNLAHSLTGASANEKGS